MSRVRLAIAVAALASLAAACQLIAGIQDHRFQLEAQPAEAGPVDSAVPDAPALPDPCSHTAPPRRPDAGFDDITTTYVFAVRTVDFSGADEAGAPLGYDLDGVCTCDSRPGTAHGGATACTPPAAVPCDFDGGVDNALYGPFRSVAGFLGTDNTGAALLGNQSECGRETLLLVVGDYNGRADDGNVRVGLIPSFGIRDPHDAGDDPDSACGNGTAAPYPAKWDGTDVWSFAEGTAIRKGPDVIPVVVTPDAYVTGYRLVVPPVRSVTLFLGNQAVELSSPAAVATLVGIDAQGNDVPPGTTPVAFRISDGVIAGRIATYAFLTSLGQLKPKGANGGLLCNYAPIAIPLKQQACGIADILTDPIRDFQAPDGSPFLCDAISTAVRFTAQPAQVGDVYSPDAGPDAGCAADWPNCR